MANIISQTPTITAGAYSANDAVGGKLTFSGCPEDGIIHGLTVIDKAKQSAVLNIVLFDQDITAVNDNAAFAVDSGDIANIIGVIQVAAADYIDVSGETVATIKGVNLPYELNSATKDGRIYGQAFTTGTPTYGSTSDLIFKLAVLPYRG